MSNRISLTASPLGMLLSLPASYLYVLGLNVWNELGPLILTCLGILHFVLLYQQAGKFSTTIWGELMRGAMIGLNTGLNGWILLFVFDIPAIAVITLMLLVSLSSFLAVSRERVFHTFLGWVNWILPMSWPVLLPGLCMFMLNLFFTPIGYIHPLLRGLRVRVCIDLSTCTFTMYGGLIRPVRGFSGLNMGNFIFINPGWEHLLRHEIGHLFSLSVMGAVFHYVGGIDEAYLQTNYWEAYAEYLAESYNSPGETALSMWR